MTVKPFLFRNVYSFLSRITLQLTFKNMTRNDQEGAKRTNDGKLGNSPMFSVHNYGLNSIIWLF